MSYHINTDKKTEHILLHEQKSYTDNTFTLEWTMKTNIAKLNILERW
jgi:hypothetical protein